MLPTASPAAKVLVLGTALWGWGIDRATAHGLLDEFVAHGWRIVDTATNYPINRRPQDCGLALRWISEWIGVNGSEAISVLAKFGAKDNSGGPAISLDPQSILGSETLLRESVGASLGAMAIHWDDREDAGAVAETVAAMVTLADRSLSIGFSGVRQPHLYQAAAPGLADKWWIQVKENVATDAARRHYGPDFPRAKYLAYGINMGGVKLAPAAPADSLEIRGIARPERQVATLARFLDSDHGLRPQPRTLNELALAYCYFAPDLSGAIVGPRNEAQLTETLKFWDRLQSETSGRMTSIISNLTRELR